MATKLPNLRGPDYAPTTLDDGCWIAFYSDHSNARPFPSEIEALRWAVNSGASVKFVPWGDSVFD